MQHIKPIPRRLSVPTVAEMEASTRYRWVSPLEEIIETFEFERDAVNDEWNQVWYGE